MKKIITHIVRRKNTQNVIFPRKNIANFGLHKKTTQNFICTSLEHSAIVRFWMLKSNVYAVVVVVVDA